MRSAICHSNSLKWALYSDNFMSPSSRQARAHFPVTARHSGRSLLHWETPSCRCGLSARVPEYKDHRHFDLLRRVAGTYRRVAANQLLQSMLTGQSLVNP